MEKYTKRFCNTQFSELKLDAAEFAIICLLLLRGPQTPGELRAHSGRLHGFADNGSVIEALSRLVERESGPLVVKLPRSPGRKDSEYMHLFAGDIDLDAYTEEQAAEQSTRGNTSSRVADLEQRVGILENELLELKKLLSQ